MKEKNWGKAKANASKFAANMGAPVQRRSRKAPMGFANAKGKKKK